MNENLDLTKILKDCPKGTEFYSPICGKVEFEGVDAKREDYPITVYCKQSEDSYSFKTEPYGFTADGRFYSEAIFGECLLFPSKDQRDWSKWHRPFVDGDVVTVNGLDIGIYAHENTYYCMLCDNTFYKQTIGNYYDIRLATAEEKEKLFQAIKDNGYQWNAEEKKLEKLITPKFKVGDRIRNKHNNETQTQTIVKVTDGWYHCEDVSGGVSGIPVSSQDDYKAVVEKTKRFDPKTLQPFDKVLVRDESRQAWTCDFFSFLYDKFVRCVGACYVYCIPYNDDTKHLVDKKSEAPEYYRYWESETKEECTDNKINGREYVDLGLPSGLKWATCNVGASSPEDYGNYYAWGETSTKTTYTEDNCTTYGKRMSDISGNAQYDVARKKWGSTWRMPTKAEQQELLDNCTWEWTTQNGVNGYKVTGPNGNSIFLPAAGYRYGTTLNFDGYYGGYWSSTPDESGTNGAYYLYFNSGDHYVGWFSRNYGLSVRPVTE